MRLVTVTFLVTFSFAGLTVGGVVLYVCAVPSMMKAATIANIGVVAQGNL